MIWDKWRHDKNIENPTAKVTRQELRDTEWGLIKGIMASMLIALGLGVGAALGVYYTNEQADGQNDDIVQNFCETVQGFAAIESERTESIAARDREVARLLDVPEAMERTRAVGQLFDGTADTNTVYSQLQREFATTSCDKLPPASRVNIQRRYRELLIKVKENNP